MLKEAANDILYNACSETLGPTKKELGCSPITWSRTFLCETLPDGVFAYSNRNVRLSACRVVYRGQTVQGRPMMCLDIEYACK